MDDLNKLTTEELIEIIVRLRSENERLKTSQSSDSSVGMRFKKKYAERILDSLPDMLTVLDKDGMLVDLVSSEETNHVGVSSEAIIGQNICSILSEDAYRNVKANLDTVNATGHGATSNHDITLDNVTRHYENRIFPLDEGYSLCMCRDVTDAVKAQTKLELANTRMRKAEEISLLNHWYYFEKKDELYSPGIIPKVKGVKDPASKRCSRKYFFSQLSPQSSEALRRQFENPLVGDDYVEYKIELEGGTRYFHSRVINVSGEKGDRVIEGYAQDMTYIVESVHELEMVKYALNNTEDEIYACDTDGNMEFANRQFMLYNNVGETICGRRIDEFEPFRSDPVKWSKRLEEIRRANGAFRYTMKFRNGEGHIVAMEIVSYLIYDPSKEKEIVWFFTRNVTVNLEQETKLRELNYVMDAILNNIPVYLFVKDPGNEFRYLYWNKAFGEYSGITAEDALGHTDYEIFPNLEDAEKFRKDDLELLRTGVRLEFTEEYIATNGERRVVNTSKALVPSENRLPLIIGVSWDITDMKNAEKALIAARIKAEESDRLKSAFLANMSHEIRTPLNAIVGFSKLIADADTEAEKRQFSDIIDSNAELLLQLINDILDLSKIEAGTLEFNYKMMDLNELCREEYEIHKSRMKNDVTLVFEEKYEEVKIMCDPNRLAQVITNLLTNASKFTEHGEVRFGFDIRGGRIVFYVSDTGIGMPRDKMNTVFDRFVKFNSFVGGTGLGLSISKMIIEKLNGHLSVESEEGKGSTFRFDIPFDTSTRHIPSHEGGEAEGDVLQEPAITEEKKRNERAKVLIAEDIDSNFMLVNAFLKERYDMVWAHDGQEAVEMFESESPDLILMDIKMPRMTGYEAARAIRLKSSDVPIIAATAFAFGSDRDKALEAGCDDYITKPISKAALEAILEKYLGRE